MIVLVSDNAEVVAGISTLLKQKGDLFSVAADEPRAYAAIRADRATLLIVDTCSAGFNGFALCGAVKNDPDLAGLPVLCIIGVDSLTSILSFLDCNGDGFLMPPFDLPSLSSAIGDLQDRQVETKTQEAVRTRFRINHDGREYTVVADRRQLLEHLLSAYETALRLRNEQERVRGACLAEMRAISGRLASLSAERDDTVANLHKELEERTAALATTEAALQAKEQSEGLWRTRFENVALELKELGTAFEALKKSEEEKTRTIAALESDSAEAAIEKKLSDQEHSRRIETLTSHLEEAALGRDSARSTVAALDVKIAEMERQFGAAEEELHDREESIRSLNSELEQNRLKIQSMNEDFGQSREMVQAQALELGQSREKIQSLTGELRESRERVLILSGELEKMARDKDSEMMKCRELESVLQKIRSEAHSREEEVRAALNDLTSDLHSIQGALEQNLRQLEQELGLRKDLERDNQDLIRERETLSQRAEEAEASLAGLQNTLAAERDSRIQVETERDSIRTEHDRVRGMVDATLRDLKTMQEENRTLSAVRDREIAAAAEIAALKDQIVILTRDLAEERGIVERERQARTEAEAEGAALARGHAEARNSLDSASRDISAMNAALDEERKKRKAVEDRLLAAEQECGEKERRLATLEGDLKAAISGSSASGTGPEQTGQGEAAPLPSTVPSSAAVASRGELAERPLPPEGESPGGSIPPVPGETDPEVRASLGSHQVMLPPTKPAISLPGTPSPVALPQKAPDLPAAEARDGGSGGQDLTPAPDVGQPSQFVPPRGPSGDIVIGRDRWLDIIKWAHHTEALTPEDRKNLIADLMRLSKLVQKGRHLTNRQDEEIRMVVARVQSLGYRFA